mgnify:CR=1 FL=1
MLLPLASSVPPSCGDVSATNEAIPPEPVESVAGAQLEPLYFNTVSFGELSPPNKSDIVDKNTSLEIFRKSFADPPSNSSLSIAFGWCWFRWRMVGHCSW